MTGQCSLATQLTVPKLRGLHQRQIRLVKSEEIVCVGGGLPTEGSDSSASNIISNVMKIHCKSPS